MRLPVGFAVLFLLLLAACVSQDPWARAGVLDLSAWRPSSTETVALSGEWSVERDDGAEIPGGLLVSGSRIRGSSDPETETTVTYRLELHLPQPNRPWALILPELPSASQLSIDGTIVSESGVLGPRSTEEVPLVRGRLVTFTPSGPVVLLSLRVSDGHRLASGPMGAVRLGPVEAVEARWNTSLAVSAFLVSALIVLALVNALVAGFPRQRPGLVWYSVLAVIVAVQSALSGPDLVATLLPSLRFDVVLIVQKLMVFASMACLVLFMKAVFPQWWPSLLFLAFLLYTLLFSVLVLLLPLSTFNTIFVSLWLPAAVAMALMCVGIVVWAVVKQHEEGRWLLVPLVVFLGAGLHDGLAAYFAVPGDPLIPFTMLAFMLFNAVLVSRTMRKTFEVSSQQALELRKLDVLKDDFLARVTHELRTPLHGVLGILEAFRSGDFGSLQDRQSYHLALVEASGKRLLSMVNSILDFNQLKQGKVGLETRPIFFKEAVDFLIPSFHALLPSGVALVNHVSSHLPPALGDDGRFEQVLQALLTNALAHTTQGTISLDGELQDQSLTLTVRDTGSGIDAETLQTLFTPFRQGDDVDTREKNGLGLGLATARLLMQAMGGSLALESAVGVGTSVKLTLPVCPPAKLDYFLTQRKAREIRVDALSSGPPRPFPTRTSEARPTRTGQGPVVLIVDDEPVNLLVLRTFLQRLDYQVIEATGGPEALSIIESTIVDLVILDVMMPGMSGYEVCRSARQRFTAARLPILLLTAKNQVEDVIAGFGAGASDFLTKPFIREELRARLEFHLDLSATARNGSVIPNKG